MKNFPSHEKFLLTAQILDSSRSITANIAEGYGSILIQTREISLLFQEAPLQKQWNICVLHLMKIILMKLI